MRWWLLIFAVCSAALGCGNVEAGVVSVRDFGAVGDASTDDTAAFRKAFAASKEVHVPTGIYVISDGLELPESVVLTGDGSPTLGVFPLKGDDKIFLSKGHRSELPGTTLLFRGAGKASSETGRSDQFASVRYALKTGAEFPFRIEKLAIALDVEVFTEKGRATKLADDRRSDFDVGLLIDDSSAGTVRDVSVFGYWKKAGLCLVSRGVGDNPDYNTFWNCSFMGEHGVALLGQKDEDGPGLSGTQFHGCRIFANDHHQRSAGQWGTAALFIDGKTGGKRADLNGHYFFGGCIRTYNNVAVKLDHASNVAFHGVVFEVPAYERDASGTANTTGKIVGTANTRDVYLFGCRMHDIGLNELAAQMGDGSIMAFPDALNSMTVMRAGKLARLSAGNPAGPSVQFSENGRSSNSGWVIRSEDGGDLVFRLNNELKARLSADGQLKAGDLTAGIARRATAENGRLEVRGSRIRCASPAATEVHTLSEGIEGQLLILEQAPGSKTVIVVSNEAGNIRLPRPFEFRSPQHRLTLMRSGEHWVELSRVE